MAQLTKGRTEPCRNNIGGIRDVYLANYIPLSITEYTRNGSEVTPPPFFAYKFYAENINFSENIQNDENGEVYNQNLSFRLNKINSNDSKQLFDIKDLFFRVVLVFNDGKIRLLGFENGLNLSYVFNSGGKKDEGTSYEVTFEGRELETAPYLANLDNVITTQYLQLENGEFLQLENGNLIELE